MALVDPPPLIAPIAEGRNELLGADWQRWFLNTVLGNISQAGTIYAQSIALSNQSTSIGTTNIPLPSLSRGDYVFFYYARITVTDGVSSSLTVRLGWTEGAVSLTLSGAAMTGDTTTTVQSASVPVFIDAATPLSYSTIYASNTPAKMRYTLRVKVLGLQ